MFKRMNLEEKIRINTRISQVFLFIVSVIAIAFMLNSKDPAMLSWAIGVFIVFIIGAIAGELLKKWVSFTIANPIFDAVIQSNNASNEAIDLTSKQENFITKHLELLKNAAIGLDKLSSSSYKTKMSAQRLAEKSQEALILSSKEQEAVKANIEKMRTLKQKIEIIAELILELSEHTQQIGSIIGVVEDITEQTNMLALNAAVEAARAGEHGKGFAVVASEIRKLADESKQATTKITSLIHDIQQATNSTVMATEEGTKEIESGVDLAHQIAQSIDVLRYTINETVQSVEGIVNAASNQSICTNEVSEVINALDQGLTESAVSIKLNLKTLTTLMEVSRSLKKTVMGREELIETRRYKD